MQSNEKELVVTFRQQFEAVSQLETSLDKAKSELEETKQTILEMFEQTEKERTATYEGVGFISRTKPRLYANCPEERRPELFELVRSFDRADLIKENIAPQTLSAFVTEFIENGKPVPECISYILKPGVRLYTK